MGENNTCSWKASVKDYPLFIPGTTVVSCVIDVGSVRGSKPDKIAVWMDGKSYVIPEEHFKRMVREYCYANDWQWKEDLTIS